MQGAAAQELAVLGFCSRTIILAHNHEKLELQDSFQVTSTHTVAGRTPASLPSWRPEAWPAQGMCCKVGGQFNCGQDPKDHKALPLKEEQILPSTALLKR